MVRGVDVREYIFGKDLHVILFGAVAAFIFFIVRAIDALVFNVFFSRRRNVAAPQLLRGIISIVLYFVLFLVAVNTIFNFQVKTVLTGGTVVAAVVALALQDTLGNMFSGIALHMEDTFEVGDVIHSGDHYGVVEGVSWRAIPPHLRSWRRRSTRSSRRLLRREGPQRPVEHDRFGP